MPFAGFLVYVKTDKFMKLLHKNIFTSYIETIFTSNNELY